MRLPRTLSIRSATPFEPEYRPWSASSGLGAAPRGKQLPPDVHTSSIAALMVFNEDALVFYQRLRGLVSTSMRREEKARSVCEAIREAGAYRWVGIYKVEAERISVIGWSGPAAPTHSSFPVTQGLNGEAVRSARSVVVGDVRADPRYLTTLSSTRAEMVVPVSGGSSTVIGTIDVESEFADSFTDADRRFVEGCAAAAASLLH